MITILRFEEIFLCFEDMMSGIGDNFILRNTVPVNKEMKSGKKMNF